MQRTRPIDIRHKDRGIELLPTMSVGDAWTARDAPRQLVPYASIVRVTATDDPDVDLRRRSEN